MKPKSLLEKNPYLKDAAMREKLVTRSANTSCGVEGVKVDLQTVKALHIPKRKR